MEYNSISLQDLSQQSIEPKRLFRRINVSSYDAPLPHNIFRSNQSQYTYNPNDKPVGGINIVRRIRESTLKSLPSDTDHKVTLSTKMDTLQQESGLKVKTEFNSTPAPKRIESACHPTAKKQDVLKKDLIGLSVDHIKVMQKRALSNKTEKQSIYDRTAKPFLESMGQRSMSEYSQQLRKKFGNRYFQKTLRNAYQDDAQKTFMVTLFDKEQKQIKPKLRKNIVNLPFFKRHQFIQVKGISKKQKEVKATRPTYQ